MRLSPADIFIDFIVLLFSLTVHEMAHAWSADRLGDPTARLLGRVSLNPLVHIDPIGTVLFPLISMVTGATLLGWAKPVPVDVRRLRHQRRDYVLVAAAGPASNLVLATLAALVLAALHVSPYVNGETNMSVPIGRMLGLAMQLNVLLAVFNMLPIPPLDGGNVLGGLLPERAAASFNLVRPDGFILLYGLILSGYFWVIIGPPFELIMSLLPTQ